MKENLNDLRSFLIVAQTGSFSKAAELLGVSPSALSHCIRGIEERLKIKLLQRTTRSVATTEAGEQLYQKLSPLFQDIDHEINALGEFRNSIKGKLRINSTEQALQFALRHKFAAFCRENPEVELELVGETRFMDIVAERFDAGIRLGADVAKDMIAVPVSPEMQMCVVASPDYLTKQGTPKTPQELTAHQCLGLRLPSGGLLNWEFRQPDSQKTLKISPSASLSSNNSTVLVNAALDGLGLAWLPKENVQTHLNAGQLVETLSDWAMRYEGYYLYYPNRRADSPLFQALVKALREQKNGI